MQTTFLEQEKVFTSQKAGHIGTWQIFKDDHITVVDRGDGLWNVLINGTQISYAIDGTIINDLAGFNLVEA
jgi:hypothetical protein